MYMSNCCPDGEGASPRGENGKIVYELDERILLLPDWWSSNWIDSLKNIVLDLRIAVMLIIGA